MCLNCKINLALNMVIPIVQCSLHVKLYPAYSLIDPLDLPEPPPSSFHHLLFSPPPDPDLLPRITTVDKPELTPFLPPPGNLFRCASRAPSSSPASSCFRFLELDPCSPTGRMLFSHSFRCNRYTAIVALASVTYITQSA
jgi:hypothetical protein